MSEGGEGPRQPDAPKAEIFSKLRNPFAKTPKPLTEDQLRREIAVQSADKAIREARQQMAPEIA